MGIRVGGSRIGNGLGIVVFHHRRAGVKGCKNTSKLAKDVRKCGGQNRQKQTQKRMKKTILRGMAPLVAGVLLLGQLASLHADFPYITSIQRSGNSVWIGVATGGSVPYGHTDPAPAYENYFWWVEGQRTSQHDHSYYMSHHQYFTDACVYVYPDDNSNEYSYAFHFESTGGYIWNGP